ncbi:hypothetical protein THAOC_35938 [Thalassiosira oceanica]|uniref:Helicase-associated domain-containing protein n=1 Tax=Thalassiosira oceanica TaxID=159749 RepID=K0R109_THAOC|nr:hypothetical protein THAOC_35938 [Thalassiosira oceanica]|eukprot:EJK45450.1 hypothetical protein THAOC_35938 [Thalassiosira oceanica]
MKSTTKGRKSTPVAKMKSTTKSRKPGKRITPWEVRLNELSQFKAEHGHCKVPKNQNAALYSLYRWFEEQRARKRNGKLIPYVCRGIRFGRIQSLNVVEQSTRLSDMSQISSLQFVSIQRRAAIIAIIGGLFLSIWAYLTPDFVSATNGWIYGLRGPFARTFSALSIVFGAFTLEILRRNLQHREHIETLWTLAIWSAYFASLCQVSAVFAVFASRTCAHGCFMVSLSVIGNELSLWNFLH